MTAEGSRKASINLSKTTIVFGLVLLALATTDLGAIGTPTLFVGNLQSGYIQITVRSLIQYTREYLENICNKFRQCITIPMLSLRT